MNNVELLHGDCLEEMAVQGGWRFIGIEKEREYLEMAKARIAHAQKVEKPVDLFEDNL